MNKSRWKLIFAELGCFVLQVFFSRVLLFDSVCFVGFPFAISRLCYGHNLMAVVIEYFVANVFWFSDFNILLIVGFEVVVLSLYYFAREFLSTKKERFLMCVFVAVSTVLKLYFSFETLETVVKFLIEFILKILTTVYFHKFFAVYKKKFLFFKFSSLDYFLFSLMILFLSAGFFGFNFLNKWLGVFAVAFLVLMGCRIMPAEKFFVMSGVFAISAVFVTGNEFYLMFSVLAAIVLINFKEINKYLFGLISLIVFAVLIVIFNFYYIFAYFSLIFAVFCLMLIPNRVLIKVSALFEQDSFNMIFNEVQNMKVENIKNKLSLMSKTFLDMQTQMTFLLVGKVNREQASAELSKDVILKCCKNCENYRYCFLETINKETMFKDLLFSAIEKGSVSRDMVASGMQAYCMKSGIIVNEINQMAGLYLSYEQSIKNEDSSKLMVANEFGNFADIFSNFAKMLKYSLKINKNSSKIIKENCFNALVEAKEVLVFENEQGVESVNVIAENELLLKKETVFSIEKAINNHVKLQSVKHLNVSGLSLATFVPAEKIKVDFAVSSKAKESRNGDSAVVCKLGDNKYFLAIADGMGHGKKAGDISSMVLGLVKSMFEVGFDDELILQSVNKLLVPVGLDNFTTFDACVIDLKMQVCNFIKLGASVSVIKHRDTCEVIYSNSLPIGIVQNIKPTIVKKHICAGDMIFLASDGVVDSFKNIDDYKHFINDAKIFNIQKFADNLIFDAGFQNKKHLDDMTVIAINLLKNH